MMTWQRKRSITRTFLIFVFAFLLIMSSLGGGALINASGTGSILQIPPSADTYLNAGSSANLNYGTVPTLQVRTWTGDPNYTRESYMKFDLSSYTGELGAAKLNVYAALNNSNGSPWAFQLYGVEDDAWTEHMTTWNYKPAMEHYLANVNVGLTWKWIQVDVTAFVKAQLAKDQTASFGFTQEAKGGALIHINSKESTANQPYLTLSGTRVNEAAPLWPSNSNLQVTQLDQTGLNLNWSEAAAPAG
ncbi:MAG: hypothetical protein K0Q73_7473, partial [Paenibacillus sp.]|nr:hypothetical protein [Paenibacillus sp.]